MDEKKEIKNKNHKLRFYCTLCSKTISLTFTDEFKQNFKNIADKWPYPFIYHHANHWAIVYIDSNFQERGVIFSKIGMEEEKEEKE